MQKIKIKYDLKENIRLDKYICYKDIISRSQLKIRLKKVVVNEKKVKLSKKLKLDDKIELWIEKEIKSKIIPQEIPIEIIFENKDIIVINKNQGIVVHPGAGNKNNTILNGILSHIKKEEFIEEERAGIVHRLDKDTSGVMIIAKNLKTLEYLQEQFKNREVEKEYIAITKGNITKKEGKIEGYVKRDKTNRKKIALSDKNEGKYSFTSYTLLKRKENYNMFKLKPKTGRTHQIRVHLKSIGQPIVGDKIYSNNKETKEYDLMLHAKSLSIRIKKGEEKIIFSSPVPKRLCKIID